MGNAQDKGHEKTSRSGSLTPSQGVSEKEALDEVRRDPSRRHLIVDDAVVNCEVLQGYLKKKNVESDVATSAEDALLLVDRHKNYDCIWLDVDLPGMSGIEFATLLRGQGFRRLILGVTGVVDARSVQRCVDGGMNRVLGKPVTKSEALSEGIFSIYPD